MEDQRKGKIAAEDVEIPAIAGDFGQFRARAGDYRRFADKT
jgi:hypothetical protein